MKSIFPTLVLFNLSRRLNSLDTYTQTNIDDIYSSCTMTFTFPDYRLDSYEVKRIVEDIRTKDPHSSFYIPFFHYFGKSKTTGVKNQKVKSKFNRNLRPKSTKSSRKLYI